MKSHLSHLLDAIGENVGNNNPLLRRGPQVHLHQNNIVEEHQVSYISQLWEDTVSWLGGKIHVGPFSAQTVKKRNSENKSLFQLIPII